MVESVLIRWALLHVVAKSPAGHEFGTGNAIG
jgi:hypothetical protein